MDIPTVPGAWYTVATATTCEITDTATGTPLGTANAGSYTFQAQGNLTTLSDDSALYSKSNFKSAPAALMALGLLGGGASTPPLPPGYLAAEFLEATTAGTCIAFPAQLTSDGHSIEVKTEHYLVQGATFQSEGSTFLTWGVYQNKTHFYGSADGWAKGSIQLNAWNVIHCIFENNIITAIQGDEIYTVDKGIAEATELSMFFDPAFGRVLLGKKRYLNITVDGKAFRQFVPAITPEGNPCMYDKVNKEAFTKSGGTGQFVVGMTSKQALKLAELPATGGTLTVSLPTSYESDSGVMSALDTARANGWFLTIRTYTPEAAASATTFALRRIWVRRTADENGAHVAADGTRWHVDWCVDMLTPDGSTPDAYGYELFRSQEAAVAYWELTPYVDPEAENLLTE